jgi:Fe-S cluster assembly protein SufD
MTNLDTQVQAAFQQFSQTNKTGALAETGKQAFAEYQRLGWPTQRNEDWKYTRLTQLVQTPYIVTTALPAEQQTGIPVQQNRLAAAFNSNNKIVFINGMYAPAASACKAENIELLPLDEAAAKYPGLVNPYFDKSKAYIPDGLHALNTAFAQNGLFIHIKKNAVIEEPVCITHITGSGAGAVFAQPRILVVVEENAQVQLAEHYQCEDTAESFTNEVLEMVVHENARAEYYKIQLLPAQAHHTGTTHITQAGKCYTHCVTVTLSGGTIRNNLNLVFGKENNEGHMYGLYMVNGHTHIDNHTIVDNRVPGCFSNELYKGVVDGKATGVFNGRIFVRKDAQKTNAYQSNRNILLGTQSAINTKPQLEIFADDVKCSHGCTVGRLDETAMFYMRARGIGEAKARALLLQAFAADIIQQVNIPALKEALLHQIAERLETEAII